MFIIPSQQRCEKMCIIAVNINCFRGGSGTVRRSNTTKYKREKQIGKKHNCYVFPILIALGSQIQASLFLFYLLLDITKVCSSERGDGKNEAVYI